MTTQGIEARSGETGTGSTEGESPSGKAGAPKLDWTAPLMLDDGKGTGVAREGVEGPDDEGAYRAKVSGNWRWYDSEGVPFDSALPRIINRPKPDAEPVEQLPADENAEAWPDAYQPDTVTVPRMTEAEWAGEWRVHRLSVDPLRVTVERAVLNFLAYKGLIRPDDPLDRFTASHPNWRDLPVEEAVRLALEQRGEG